MPIAYEILPEDRLVLTIWHGEVTLAEWKTHLAALLADPALDSTGLHLVDMRSAILEAAIRAGEIGVILDFLRPHRARIQGRRVAVLSGREMSVSKLVAEAVAALGLTIATFIFSRTALGWLEIDPARIESRLQSMRRLLPGQT